MSSNALQIESRARRILTDLRMGLPSSHIEGWLKVKRLSDYLRSNHKGATVSKWRESPHSIITFTPVSDELEELQVQRSSLPKLVNDSYARAEPTAAGTVTEVSHRLQFALLAKDPTRAGAAFYDKKHRLVYFAMYPNATAANPIVTVAPYDEVVEKLGEFGIRLQHVRTNVAIAHRLLKVF